MKSVWRKGLFIVFILGVVLFSVNASALASSTTKTLSTNYTLVNLGTDQATVAVNYYKDDGSAWAADAANTSFSIPGNYGIAVIRQYFDGTMTAGKGSAVVSSNSPLGAVVQIQARSQTPSSGAYSGYTSVSNKFYVPLAARLQGTASGIANSQIIIQNADSAAFNVTVDLYKGATKTYTKTIPNLQPGVSYYYDLADETNANLPAPWIGSAVVTAAGTGKIVVVSNFFTGPDALQSFNAFPVESIGPKWVVPLFFSRLGNGLSTVIAVQNLSGADIPVNGITLSCTKDATTFPSGPATITVQNPAVIASNAGYSFNPATDTTLFPNAAWGGACRIDAGSANVVAIVQMRYVGGSLVNAAAYEAIREGGTSTKMIAPLVAKRLGNGFASVVTIQNMDFTNPAHVTLNYTPSFNPSECPVAICDINHDGSVNAGDAISVGPLTIDAGLSVQRNHRLTSGAGAETTLPSGWQGSLVATSSDASINGFVQLTNTQIATGDTFMAHDAFVLP